MPTNSLIFTGEDHKYRVGDKEYPSVTRILKAEGFMGDVSHWTDWARDKGSAVHLACHLWDQDDLDEDTLDSVIVPYLEAYRKFKAETGFLVRESEVPKYHPQYLYAGTPDKEGLLQDAPSIIDLKTGQIEPWCAIQLGAYEMLWPDPHKRYGLQLRSDGTYRLVPFTDRHDRNIFLSALACYRWKQNNLRRGEDNG